MSDLGTAREGSLQLMERPETGDIGGFVDGDEHTMDLRVRGGRIGIRGRFTRDLEVSDKEEGALWREDNDSETFSA